MIEQAFIGSLLKEPGNIIKANKELRQGDITNKNAIAAYTAISNLFKEKKSVDVVTVCQQMNGDCDYSWISKSTDVGFAAGFRNYLDDIKEQGRKRRIAGQLQEALKDLKQFPSSMVTENLLNIYNTENRTTKDYSPRAVVDRFKKVVEENKRSGQVGHLTGFEFLDDLKQFYCPNHCWVIGGEAGSGKTALLVEMLTRAINLNVIVFETEMTEEQLIARYLANITGINYHDILAGRGGDRVAKELDIFLSKNVTIYDDVRDFDKIVNECMFHDYRGKVDIVLIDYVQHIKHKGTKYESQSEIAYGLQDLVKSIRATGIFFSQLPNDEKIKDSGTLRFKGAGEWHDIADVGVLLQKNNTNKRHRLWNQRKSRHGPELKQVFSFSEGYTKLKDILHEANEVS